MKKILIIVLNLISVSLFSQQIGLTGINIDTVSGALYRIDNTPPLGTYELITGVALVTGASGISSASHGVQSVLGDVQWANTAAGGAQPANRTRDSYNFLAAFDETWETTGDANALSIDGTTGHVGVNTTSASAGAEYELSVTGAIYLEDGRTNTIIGNEAGRTLRTSAETGNTMVGVLAGQLAAGSDGVHLGNRAGNQNAGSQVTNIGFQAGFLNTGGFTTNVGSRAGRENTGGSTLNFGLLSGYTNTGDNVMNFGVNAGYANAASNQINIGTEAGYNTPVLGSASINLGNQAGRDANSGGSTFIGTAAGRTATSPSAVAIGINSLENGLTSDNTVAIGPQSAQNISNSQDGIFIGSGAGATNTNAVDVVAIGRGAGAVNQGLENVFVGKQAGTSNTTGIENVFVGSDAGLLNTTGSFNVYMGWFAGFNNNGDANVQIGESSNDQAYNASDNALIGQRSFHDNGEGSRSTSIGSNSMHYSQSGQAQVMVTGQSYSIAGTGGGSTDFTLYGAADNNISTVFTYNGVAPVLGTGRVRSNDPADAPHENTALGYQAGHYVGFGTNNLYLGANAGRDISLSHLSNKLYIETNDNLIPMIGGDFSQRVTTFDRIIELRDGATLPGGYTPVAGAIRWNGTTLKHQGYDGTVWNDMY